MGLKRAIPPVAVALAALVLTATAALATEPQPHDGAAAGTEEIVELPVSFAVDNVNRTSVPCASDGKPYTIRGTVVAPRSALENPDSITLYLHAVTQGEFYWRFKDVPGYDFAHQQAERGHASVTIDRLGYGESDKPPGLGSCFGSQADTANQVVTALREGHYSVDGAEPGAFRKVFVAGHSAGGLVGTILSYSFPDNIDGFINFGWSDTPASVFTVDQLANTTARCLTGGDPGALPNYAKFGPDGDRILFHSAEPAVREAVPPLTQADPCGDIISFNTAIAADVAGVLRHTAPVLFVAGEKDALFPPPSMQLQIQRYLGTDDKQLVQLADTAHGFNYEASHLQSVDLVDSWLSAHGG